MCRGGGSSFEEFQCSMNTFTAAHGDAFESKAVKRYFTVIEENSHSAVPLVTGSIADGITRNIITKHQ